MATRRQHEPRLVRFPASFAFRLTDDDADRLRQIAEVDGLLPSEWARSVVSRELGIAFQRRTFSVQARDADLLRTLLAELGRQGNNLNQVARRLHVTTPEIPPQVHADLAALRADSHRLVAALLDALKVPTDV